jgi:hypothetical protein
LPEGDDLCHAAAPKRIENTDRLNMFPIQNAVPSRYPPVVTWTLMAANCVASFSRSA